MPDSQDFTEIPDELEFLEFFESEPIISDPQDGYWCYQYTDSNGVGIRFSINIIEKSVQIVLSLNGQDVETVVHEGAEKLLIVDDTLQGQFNLGSEGHLKLNLRPQILTLWSIQRSY